jgi:hypothetical protein
MGSTFPPELPDWPWQSPSPAEPASSPAGLERGYRRLIACYPREFRRENAEEILAVLLATAREGQRRPGFAETADLLRGAARMRMGLCRSPRTVVYAIRLMCLGATAELAKLIIILVTASGVRAAVRAAVIRQQPGVSPAALGKVLSDVNVTLIGDIVASAVAIVALLWLASAVGRGHDVARVLALIASFFCIIANGIGISQQGVTYASAATIAGVVTCAIGVAVAALLMCKPSSAYFARRPALAG